MLLTMACPVHADLNDQRNEMIGKFINERHADPFVATCAAHGNFVASTSSAIDHVEFPPHAFDRQHTTITPWNNNSFDKGKQQIKVENVVTVEGLGIARDAKRAPYHLIFRCGYVGMQILAFSWNDPVPPLKPHAEEGEEEPVTKQTKSKNKKSSTKSTAKTPPATSSSPH